MASQKEIDAVWAKGKPIQGKDPELYRRDAQGNEIHKPSYGKQGPKSWEIDHHMPLAHGGPDILQNKKPLQTQANREKSDKIPKK
jgi:hypothetical protein